MHGLGLDSSMTRLIHDPSSMTRPCLGLGLVWSIPRRAVHARTNMPLVTIEISGAKGGWVRAAAVSVVWVGFPRTRAVPKTVLALGSQGCGG